MYVGPAQLMLNTLYGPTKLSKVETSVYDMLAQSLTKTFDPNTAPHRRPRPCSTCRPRIRRV